MFLKTWIVIAVPGQKPTESLMKHAFVYISFEPTDL
jgi:hypothetical protein